MRSMPQGSGSEDSLPSKAQVLSRQGMLFRAWHMETFSETTKLR